MAGELPGIGKLGLRTLPQIRDRMSFLYLEHCVINRQDGAITVTDVRGTVHVPAASLGVLMLGPGTSLTHRAVELISNTGASLLWVGEQGVRFYAHGRPLTHSSRLLVLQASLVSNSRTRIAVARQMYMMRFQGEDVSKMTMQQLRGREGSRIRSVYRQAAERTGVQWDRRCFDPNDYSGGDPVNKALSAAHSCLYGLAHCVIAALGCSPGLGFVHTGHERSFVYDIADLYKAEYTIPIAFDAAATINSDIGAQTRRMVRDAFSNGRLIERIAGDICTLLRSPQEQKDESEHNLLFLWDDKQGSVASGFSYGTDRDAQESPGRGYGRTFERIE